MNWKRWVAAVFTVALVLCLTACGVQITGVSLPESLELEVGESEALTVEYTAEEEVGEEELAEAAGKLTLVWTSSDEAVATVDAEGTVTAVAAGEADITAAAKNGKLSASCHVVVGVGVTDVDAPEALELQLGKTETAELSASVLPEAATGVALTYESSDEQVATVGEDGTVTAVGEGECTIKIKAAGFGATAAQTETKVTVSTAATGITLSSEGGKLYVGNSANVQVYTSPEEASPAVAADVKYTSSDESVATVVGTTEGEAGFTVKGVKAGTATITVEYNGLTATYTVTVTKYVAPSNNGSTSTGDGTASGGSTGGATGGSTGGSTSTGGGTTGGGSNVGTGSNPNEGGAGSITDVVPGDGSWAVDGGDAEFDEGAVPPPPVG